MYKLKKIGKYLNYILFILILVIPVSILLELYLGEIIKINFPIGALNFNKTSFINNNIDIDVSSYFKLKFNYPKNDVEEIPKWQDIFGNSQYSIDKDTGRWTKSYPGKKTTIIIEDTVNSSEVNIIKIEGSGSLSCSKDNLCRYSELFLLNEGNHSLNIIINNNIPSDLNFLYQITLSRVNKIDSNVSKLLQIKNLNIGIGWWSFVLFQKLIFICLLVAIINFLREKYST